MTVAIAQLDLFGAPLPEASTPAAPSARPTHRYGKDAKGKVVCSRCTTERRESDTGMRKGFRREWRVLVDGQWRWVTECPPCLPPAPKPVKVRRGRGLVPSATQPQLPTGET